jgi:hypothetical protein
MAAGKGGGSLNPLLDNSRRAPLVKDLGMSGSFRVTLYSQRSAAHRAFGLRCVTKKHPLRLVGGQTPGGQ